MEHTTLSVQIAGRDYTLTLADELIKSQDDNTRLRRKLDESTHG